MLARSQMVALSHPPLPSGRVAVWAVLKLAVHPAGVVVVRAALVSHGHSSPRQWLVDIDVGCGPPSASNVSMLAEREGANTALVARVILWTTAAALLSIAAWAHGLQIR